MEILRTKYFVDDNGVNGEKCRTCLRRTNNIWQLFQEDADISSRIMACADVQIQQGDGLPNVICHPCRELLDVSYNFKCQVEKSDAKFREALKIQPIYHDTVQSANAVITEAITDDINNKEISNMADSCVEYHTEDYIEQINHDSIEFEGDSEGNSDKKILDISSYVDNRGIFTSDLKSELINKESHDSSDRGVDNSGRKPFYLELSKNNEKIEEIDENYEKSENDKNSKDKTSQRVKGGGNKLEFGRHKQEKKTKYRYVCYICEKQFINIEKLKIHVLDDHEGVERGIEGSGKNSNLEENEGCGEDQEKEKKKGKFSCNYCTKKFTYEKSFLSHARRHPEYKKGVRLRERSEEGSERRSNDSEDDDMPLEGLQCTQCGKLFATKRNLKRHISTHSGLKFNCSKCHKEFSRADKLKEHEQSKHGNEFFGICGDHDDSDSDYERKGDGDEDSRKKEKNNKRHQCPVCPRAFAHNSTLTNHMEKHKRIKQPQKRFLCEVCSKCFAQSGSLVAHMRTHTGVKPYVCNVCSRAFTKSTYLQLHLRTHSGEKPYICQYCSRAFARANTLARHITMHTGEAKYHCQICMKSFRRLTSLNEHTYTHTGQRPYACKICTKRYNNAGSLYAHTKKCKAQQSSSNSVINHFSSVDNSNDDPGHQGDDDPPIPEFILPVQSQKPISPGIIQTGGHDDAGLYSVNTKQFKHFYYSNYPSL